MNINNSYSNFIFIDSRLSHDSGDILEREMKLNDESDSNHDSIKARDVADNFNDNFKISNSNLKAVVSTNGFNEYIVITDRETGDVITKLSSSALSLRKNPNELLNEIV
ncbi:hypothetical protein [Vibrio gigantis]|uniref:hypothetical protein n=1 Tax=Vibrio gigantis TaxID=296199 RepID=UPI001BFD26A9|nr:hypothetical protein [Vibrio gigantis]